MNRKAIGKGLRFSIFSRDGFTCRYCGRQSDAIPLEVDHIVPVCQGGSNDPENLITACQDCNRGKSGKTIEQVVPTEADRLRLAQERNEQIAAAKQASEASQKRQLVRDVIEDFWKSCTQRPSVHRTSLNIVCSYVGQFEINEILSWIEKAAARCPHNDRRMGMYISGIRRVVAARRGY